MRPQSSKAPFSAHVEAWLVVGAERIAVGSVGPGYLLVREGCDIDRDTKATLEIVVDHVPSVWSVVLPDGAVPFEAQVRFAFEDSESNAEHRFVGDDSEPRKLEFPDWQSSSSSS